MKPKQKSNRPTSESYRERPDEPPVLGPDDPRYFNLNYFPEPSAGQNGVQARAAQVAAINARKAKDETMAYQIKAARRAGAAAGAAVATGGCDSSTLAGLFPTLIPPKPYCADYLANGVFIRGVRHALRHRHIQLNRPGIFQWLVHDLDYPTGGLYAYRDACLPLPNIIVINRDNGHAHGFVLLRTPVLVHSGGRNRPMAFLAAIERGMARRLNADRAYSGLIAKNPLHKDWSVEWTREEPFTLEELDDNLHFVDKRPDPSASTTFGYSRNCICFDALRHTAYREVLDAKAAGCSIGQFQTRLMKVAESVNCQFAVPIWPGELNAIVKSVAKWTWRNFSLERLSLRQSILGARGAAKRWADHEAVERAQPWNAEGISRAQWYRRKKSRNSN